MVTISTYALGSCIGLVVYDPQARAGGILHIMLPDSKLSPDKAKNYPYMFADTGVRGFFRGLNGLGVKRKTMHVLMAGGASVMNQKDVFRIGERNIAAVKEVLAEFKVTPRYEEVGGMTNRTLHLELSQGTAQLKEPKGMSNFSLI